MSSSDTEENSSPLDISEIETDIPNPQSFTNRTINFTKILWYGF